MIKELPSQESGPLTGSAMGGPVPGWTELPEAVGDAPDWIGGPQLTAVLSTMTAAGCCGVLALDAGGTIRYAFGNVFDPALGEDKGVGRKLESIFRPEVARERQEVFARLARERKSNVVIADMIRGRELWWISSAAFCEGELCGIFAVGVHPHAGAEPLSQGPEFRRLRYVLSAGPLAKLTIGELEVLRLMALGKRRDEMAADLRRTVKAVERRRTTLGRKLEAEHASELAMIGVDAGLHRMSPPELVRFAESNCGPNAPVSGLVAESA